MQKILGLQNSKAKKKKPLWDFGRATNNSMQKANKEQESTYRNFSFLCKRVYI